MSQDELDELLWWMCERQRIYLRRFERDEPAPWTDDPVLRDYHFCNVHRELDRGTQFYLEEIVGEGTDEDVLFNTILYRFFNRIKTYQRIGKFTNLTTFDPEEVTKILLDYEERHSLFSSAYRVTTQKWADSDSKAENIILGIIRDDVLENWNSYADRVLSAESMEAAFDVLTEINGVGDFLAYEIVTDLTYDVLDFSENDFVNVGPGAASGLITIFGDTDEENIYWLQENQDWIFPELNREFPYLDCKPELTLRDFEHSLCEYRKYIGVKYKDEHRRKFDPHDHDQDQLSDFV